jgi:hypothetical protein
VYYPKQAVGVDTDHNNDRRDTMTYLAFEFTHTRNTTTTVEGKIAIAGHLYSFESRKARDEWVEEQNGIWQDRKARYSDCIEVEADDLPHGWTADMAEAWADVVEEEEGVAQYLEQIEQARQRLIDRFGAGALERAQRLEWEDDTVFDELDALQKAYQQLAAQEAA